ncbi:hypothetical protein, partial [Listeria monocytogenes]|uniref:hypothetical protein n=1 Tax=Listeria monocytogenes TaxID=1639 RepID=UPI000AFBA358
KKDEEAREGEEKKGDEEKRVGAEREKDVSEKTEKRNEKGKKENIAGNGKKKKKKLAAWEKKKMRGENNFGAFNFSFIHMAPPARFLFLNSGLVSSLIIKSIITLFRFRLIIMCVLHKSTYY